LLPYIEQGARSELYDDKVSWTDQTAANKKLVFGKLNVWSCPSDQSVICGNDDYKGNYAANWGPRTYWPSDPQPPRGPFAVEYGARIDDIRDGTSNTFALMEVIQAPHGSATTIDNRGRIWNDDAGSGIVSTILTPNATAPDVLPIGGAGPAVPLCFDQPSIGLPCTLGSKNASHMGSRSRHAGGVMAVLCDGSVHFISQSIALDVWQAASTISNGEIVTLP
jgi:hypothetical protein